MSLMVRKASFCGIYCNDKMLRIKSGLDSDNETFHGRGNEVDRIDFKPLR